MAKKKRFNWGYGVSLLLLFCSLFFISPSFTGNAIGTITEKSSSLLSIILLVAGVGVFIYSKLKK